MTFYITNDILEATQPSRVFKIKTSWSVISEGHCKKSLWGCFKFICSLSSQTSCLDSDQIFAGVLLILNMSVNYRPSQVHIKVTVASKQHKNYIFLNSELHELCSSYPGQDHASQITGGITDVQPISSCTNQ